MVKVTTLVIRDDQFWKSQCSCTVILFAHVTCFIYQKMKNADYSLS